MRSRGEETNLEVLRPSRRRPQRGDIFTLRPRTRGFFLGRVISTEAKIGPMVGNILVYVFGRELPERPTEVAPLLVSDLLVPPMMTNRLPWSRGYFDTIENRPIADGEELSRHVFRDVNGKFYDETGAQVYTEPGGPVGEYGLHSYRTIDDAVSRALGIPLAPD